MWWWLTTMLRHQKKEDFGLMQKLPLWEKSQGLTKRFMLKFCWGKICLTNSENLYISYEVCLVWFFYLLVTTRVILMSYFDSTAVWITKLQCMVFTMCRHNCKSEILFFLRLLEANHKIFDVLRVIWVDQSVFQ